MYEPMSHTVAQRVHRALARLLDRAAHFVLPSWCAGCDRALPWRPSPLGLCEACRRSLPAPPRERCAFCGALMRGARGGVGTRGGLLCASCTVEPSPAFDALHAAWSYRPPLDEVIRRLKYRRLEYLADDLAEGIASVLLAIGDRHDWVTPVPLHWRRRIERGYDQAALLAAGVARRIGVPRRAFLVRTRATPAQAATSTAAGRRENVAGAFACPARRSAGLRGASVLLVDDVATTGATLEAASRVLHAAGAGRVVAAVAAATPAREVNGRRARPRGVPRSA